MPCWYDLYDLYDLAHVAGRKPKNLHDLGQRFLGWTCTSVYRSCTAYHDGKLGARGRRSRSICPTCEILEQDRVQYSTVQGTYKCNRRAKIDRETKNPY